MDGSQDPQLTLLGVETMVFGIIGRALRPWAVSGNLPWVGRFLRKGQLSQSRTARRSVPTSGSVERHWEAYNCRYGTMQWGGTGWGDGFFHKTTLERGSRRDEARNELITTLLRKKAQPARPIRLDLWGINGLFLIPLSLFMNRSYHSSLHHRCILCFWVSSIVRSPSTGISANIRFKPLSQACSTWNIGF